MKFGHEYQTTLSTEPFPQTWLNSAIDYKRLKKCIKKVQQEVDSLGLNGSEASLFAEQTDEPQIRVLVDRKTGVPLDAALAVEIRGGREKEAAKAAAKAADAEADAAETIAPDAPANPDPPAAATTGEAEPQDPDGSEEGKWILMPLHSARSFFSSLSPKISQLRALRHAEKDRLANEILELSAAVEDIIEPVREGYEAKRSVSYRDLYFWREMFRIYTDEDVFYPLRGPRGPSTTSKGSGGSMIPFSFTDSKSRLADFDTKLRTVGFYSKLRTPAAKLATQKFLDLNLEILKYMHFQEVNIRATRKILKKFTKRTNLVVPRQVFIKDGLVASIARDLYAELASKVLSITPQPQDWMCPVCGKLAWKPVRLGCCDKRFCVGCVVELQAKGRSHCVVCDAESVMKANGRNIDFEALEFMLKYFRLEVRKREKEFEGADEGRSSAVVEHHDEHKCAVM
ncbi:hypothetical protein K470DRAFT_243841 [Piedraia hortae CBS 480.64]|uniref:SPX domain-containing protein n=1 Tax=Piedraia hortae CBS 480.64 TaxID=1314780 RepID=A0A6A7C5F8_9PEZI|nr:hypothetical protein K470DRAFT_243841 [Piedraia hortae CBS 480.64]